MKLRTLAAAGIAFLASCASIPSADEVARMGSSAIVGAWTSELDETKLTVAKDGSFKVVRGEKSVAGRWSLDGDAVVFENDGEPCAGVEGAYVPEVVRDTVRFTKRGDDCPAREERMAWPWRRSK